ncbi:hypothetical protein FQR65_LT20220 [Abscondita terminalis]|nr:hypothetical protein FQR65_LT20220 [Abscondita terminalis]
MRSLRRKELPLGGPSPEKWALSDVLPEGVIQDLAEAFEGYREESLNGLKKNTGINLPGMELKLFRASQQ